MVIKIKIRWRINTSTAKLLFLIRFFIIVLFLKLAQDIAVSNIQKKYEFAIFIESNNSENHVNIRSPYHLYLVLF